MSEAKNRQQAAVDAAVKAAKDRRHLVEVAERAMIAPESLSLPEILIMSTFVLAHKDCWAAKTG